MKRLTSGERAVWAAAYVDELRALRNASNYTSKSGETARHSAIELACYAVEELREELESIKDGFGADDAVYLHLESMLKQR